MQAPTHKTIYELGYDEKRGWSIKAWEAFCEYNAEKHAYWEWMRNRRFHTLPEYKGIPVPGTSSKRWHSAKDSGKTGVIGNSRILPHRYMDEGDKGPGHRREIKRKERALWRSEWQDEQRDQEDGYSVSEWFDSSYDDYLIDPLLLDFDPDWCDYCNGPCEL